MLIALLAGAASGILTSVAFPPVDAGWLAWVSLVPLALCFRSMGAREIVVAGAAFGLSFFGLLLTWIWIFGAVAFFALIASQTAWVVALLVAGLAMRKATSSVVAFPAAIVAGEFLRAHLLLTGFTWGGLGYAQHDSASVLRIASYTGVWGISFSIALTAALIAETIARLRIGLKALVWAAPVLAVVAGPALLPVNVPAGKSARIAVVQGNGPEDLDSPGWDDLTILENHSLQSLGLGRGFDLVVWPEQAAGSDPLDDPGLASVLTQTVRSLGAPLLTGARLEVGQHHFRNSAYLFDERGGVVGRYDKTRLVPFGEYVPLRKFLVPLVHQLEQVPKDGIPGSRLTLFQLPKGKVASVICFESTFPDLVGSFMKRGAGLVTVITNNASFARSAASRQHVAFSQLRAAENRVWIVHAALTGISAVVAPDGRVVVRTGLFERATLTATVRFATRPTLYARFGDWLPWLSVAGIGVALAAEAGRWAGRRRVKSS